MEECGRDTSETFHGEQFFIGVISSSKQEGPEEAFEAKDGVPSTDRCGVSRIMNPIKRNLCWSSKRLGGVDNLTKPSDISLESVQSEDTSEKKKNVEAMFSFFSSGNEILWFR